jgi:predicted DCC family thiol-disulfide oxidoreductase YuxK
MGGGDPTRIERRIILMTRHIETISGTESAALTVYFDGECPLCAAEIAYYRRQDTATAVRFLNASQDRTVLGSDLGKRQAMARFHVRTSEGSLVTGAAAFIELWRALPRLSWAARLAGGRRRMAMLEIGYRSFLQIRPGLSKLARWLQNFGSSN